MLSFVIPAYNERESLGALVSRLQASFPGTDVEFLFIDDGSSDDTFAEIERLAASDRRIRGISFRRNFGKSAAMSAGFRKASGDVIVTMDADLQDQPEEVHKLLERIAAGDDMVIGWKYPRLDPWTKRFPSKVINAVTSSLTGLHIHDMNSGLKAMTREVIENVGVYGELHRFLPPLAHMKGFVVSEVKVAHAERRFGHSKFGAKRFLSGIFDLTTILFLGKFGKKPLHLFGLLGLALLMIGFGINLYIAWLKFTHSGILDRLPLLLLGILNVVVGVQFISIGLIGELITSFTSRTTTYTVRKEI